MSQDSWVRDQLEIRSLIEAYSDGVTRRDPDAIMALWAEDCRWSVPDMEGLEDVRGKDAIRSMFEAAQGLFKVTFLTGTPGNITITGDTATARTYTHEVLESTEGETRHAVGLYEDKFGRIDGQWLFTERTWHMIYQL